MTTPPIPAEDANSRLRDLLAQRPARLNEVLEFFDSLPPAATHELRGTWKGRELPTGNPLDGLLGLYGWHGKSFDDPEDAHPLVMDGRRGTFSLNPAMVPINTVVRLHRLLKNPALGRLARVLLPLFATKKPAARLRTIEYRGVPTATMVYDALPIHDHFRRIDRDTVLGAMDLRSLDSPFIFVLEREDAPR
ncbi:DUF4334 domain-containing protein [Corynebacterium halotolerans]|uniref:GXWXG domain-containing protein n=1 Tax=Corynebacterium halotolerans YIM 70093 = DSM 44683 TaxID=1121362 RepID=M1MZC2_9CORY|nr:DUF4334 domain-containing protein [Corynebacterium halotolerans]AGF73034.1 hypothetical protein A605_10160 [Corynebacterium halotolerans YIM 70093 = DSM 44683]